jgi:two-component system sensor histidine kinase AtoS
MRSFTSQFTSKLLGKSGPGLEEVCSLINFDDNPCALIDHSMNRLVFLNSQLVKMTAYSTDDVKEKATNQLFPSLELKSISTGEIRTIDVNRRGQSTISSRVRFDFLDPQAHWLIIRFIDKTDPADDDNGALDLLINHFNEFVKLAESMNLEQVPLQSMDLASQMLGVQSTYIYQADPGFPVLRKTSKSTNAIFLPDELPSTDLVRLNDPILWKPGNRVFTELHRFARINSIDFVATAPLKQDDAKIGFLVACGTGQVPSELRISVLELLSSLVMILIQQSLLVRNLEEKILLGQDHIDLHNEAIENMQEGLLLLLPDLTISEINPAAEWMLGYANREVKGQSYDNILIGTDRLIPAMEDAKKGNTTHDIGKVNLNRRSGQSFPAQIKVIPVMQSDQLLGIEVLLVDISENEQRKALTQQLEHRAVLGDYTAAFAHDVRNPINNISTGIQLLGAKLPTDDPNQEIITRVQNDCTRLNQQMESFLAFSRPLELKFESIDLKTYLPRIVDRWRPRLSRVNVTPSVHVDSDIANIIGDPRSLDQVFTNLISNAVDAMTDTGDTLAIRAVMNHEISGHPHVDIIVSDNGPGIPEDIKSHIFEPFVTTRQKGTGLGLAITKQIVTAHKGSISVNSFPGGTVFTVRLPTDNGD